MSQAAEIIHTPAAARPDAFDWQDPLDLEDELQRLIQGTNHISKLYLCDLIKI